VNTDRRGWYAVSLSNGVSPGTSNGTRLFDEEIVVWRDANGMLHVWADRCPHRGMRLSFGFVRSDRIACLYHGWQYGSDGRCRHTPAHPGLQPPESIAVWRHSTHEALGLVFAHFGEAKETPALPAGTVWREFIPVRSIHVDCPAARLVDRFAALAITPFDGRLKGETFALTATEWLVAGAVEKDGIGEALVGAVQPIGANHSALHLVVASNGANYRGAPQRYFSRIVERLRNGIASGSPPMTGPLPPFC
jgi:nitrite reductase/ring-hydroxylating ferredoxin subunit